MKHRLGIYFVAVAFLLTWPLHIGAGSYVFTKLIGSLFAPQKSDQIWGLLVMGGGVLTLLLLIGMLKGRRWALYVSALVLVGGMFSLATFRLASVYDWLLETAVAALLVLSASYLLWTARHATHISRVAQSGLTI